MSATGRQRGTCSKTNPRFSLLIPKFNAMSKLDQGMTVYVKGNKVGTLPGGLGRRIPDGTGGLIPKLSLWHLRRMLKKAWREGTPLYLSSNGVYESIQSVDSITVIVTRYVGTRDGMEVETKAVKPVVARRLNLN